MKICHIVPSLEAQHGGPSRSVRALANEQAELGHEVDLLATLPSTPVPLIETHARLTTRLFNRDWPQIICPSAAMNDHLRSRGDYSLIHEHSLWLRPLHYASTAALLHKVPLMISPRGMLSPWALRHHRWKKELAAKHLHPNALPRAKAWHATSDLEANDIRALGFKQPICISPNGVFIPTAEEVDSARKFWLELCPEAAINRVALFHSRLHSKKRILELIDLWTENPHPDWVLLIVGIPEEYDIPFIKARIASASANGRIFAFDGSNRPPPYAIASLFLLPSHSENFGLVIAEAMAWCVPPLVTDGTPWMGLNEREAGWCMPWDLFPATLKALLSESTSTLRACGRNARRWVASDFSWQHSATILLEFYEQLRI